MTEHLGPLESWPTFILQHLFIDRPSPTRISRIRKVILFLYGKDVSLKMAYTFYTACCGCTGATARFVVEQPKEWYCERHCSLFKRHIAEYYNVLFKQFYYINGSELNQRELVLPEVTSIQFGIDDTTHPHKIRRRLEEMRTTETES